jgi:AAA15 family ATPase/GTPase
MDNYHLNSLILEDFKIFKGQHVFNFNDLNIFTGANNSGKSTIIKAINFFSKSLENGDFASVDLMGSENPFSDFSSLVNHESKEQSFKIGTHLRIGRLKNRFKLLYTFVNGPIDSWDEDVGKATFAKIEIVNEREETFVTIFNTGAVRLTKENLEFDLEEVARKYPGTYKSAYQNPQDFGFEIPFISPTDWQCPGLITIKINLHLLRKYIDFIADENFTSLLDYVSDLKSNKNNLWLECFNENQWHYADYNIYELKFNDLIDALLRDDYFNIGDFDTRYALIFDSDTKFEWENYQRLVENLKYRDFIKQVVAEIIKSIDKAVEVFRGHNIIHIGYQIFDKHLIPIDNKHDYLRSIYQLHFDVRFYHFFYEAMNIFGLDWYVDIKQIAYSFFELQLITGVSKQVNEIEAEKKSTTMIVLIRIPNFAENPKVNICNLGKGSASLVGIMLNISSILFSFIKEIDKKISFNEWVGSEPEKVIQNTILIEEPETFLHPDWQSKLADLFIFCSKWFNEQYGEKYNLKVRFVVETHSVYLIQRLQLLAARKEFDPEKVDILYFNKSDETEKFYKITLRDDGILDQGFGTGFYDETANLTADILNARKMN